METTTPETVTTVLGLYWPLGPAAFPSLGAGLPPGHSGQHEGEEY